MHCKTHVYLEAMEMLPSKCNTLPSYNTRDLRLGLKGKLIEIKSLEGGSFLQNKTNFILDEQIRHQTKVQEHAKEILLSTFLGESQGKKVNFSRLDSDSSAQLANKKQDFWNSITREEASIQWSSFVMDDSSVCCSAGCPARHSHQRNMRYVETWLQDCQEYNKRHVKNGKQTDADKLSLIVSCPPWMKTAGQMRRGRNIRNSGRTFSGNNEERKSSLLKDDGSGNQLAFGDKIVNEQRQATNNEGNSKQRSSAQDNGSNFGIMSFVTIDEDGVSVSELFKEINVRDQNAFITCCFQHDNTETSQFRTDKGFLTCKKILQ